MGSKRKIELLIPGLLAMLLLISSEVAMAARNFKEGEVVKETNEVGNAQLVGGVNIPGTIGTTPGIVNSITGIIASIPGIVASILPGILGGIPGIGGFFGGGYPGQGGYGGAPYCPYGC